jgi:hypothetical protein
MPSKQFSLGLSYVVPSNAWVEAAPPLTDRDYVGRKSEPEYGIEIGAPQVPLLRRFRWSEAVEREYFS